ncbi:MAG: hypothetical protein MUF23_15565 [Pirellula sp.]|nr:hypothetical protein [Pirellula sp.]
MTWFEDLVDFSEETPEQVRSELWVDEDRLHSRRNGRSWQCGRLETPTLAELRERVRNVHEKQGPISVSEVVANVQHLASQFNLLEMTSPGITPECGVGIYEEDLTQGPACAIAAGAGTIFRNYFAQVNGQIGQSAHNQIDCLAGIGALLDNSQQRLWKMVNGYALPTSAGLEEIRNTLADMNHEERDRVRQALQIGIQWDTQVTLGNTAHSVTQAYCSAMPVAYTTHPPEDWRDFATLVLEAAYEATICASIIHRHRTGCNRLFLTLLGGGVFGNNPEWILSAIRRALDMYSDSGLDVAIVSFGESKQIVRRLVNEYA